MKGVERIVSGYTGGVVPNPSYEQVCSGVTGHAEAVQITFDPKVSSYRELLDIFFSIHDPTTMNRQGNDIGTQYRSAIFYYSTEQKTIAEQTIQELKSKKVWPNPIVTAVVPFDKFYAAEEYHQDYYRHNSGQSYCQIVISPKLSKFRSRFSEKTKR